jgi:hypothetical protein
MAMAGKASGPQGLSERGGDEKSCRRQESNFGPPSHILVTTLSYPNL